MRRSLPSAFAFALSIGVSSFALAMDDNSALTALPPPQAPKARYIPSVPARDTTDTTAITTPPQHYIPSVPARVVEDAPGAAPWVDPEAMSAPAAAPITSLPTPAPLKTAEIKTDQPSAFFAPASQQMAPIVTTSQPTVVSSPTHAAEIKVAQPAVSSAPAAQQMAPIVNGQPPSAAVSAPELAPPPLTRTDPTPTSPLPMREVKKEEAAAATATWEAPREGINSALAKAYNFNPELFSFRSRLKAADEQIPQAYAGWLPSAKVDYGYGYDKEKVGHIQYPGTHPISRSVTVSQPIFNGGETLARTSRAFNTVDLARAQLTDAEQRILGDATKAYMGVVRTNEILKLSINNEQVLKEQLQATKDRFTLGETTHTDVAQSEARLARATSDKVTAEGNFDVAKATYLRVIGETAPLDLKMPIKLPSIPKSLEEALNIGLTKNPNLIAAQANRDIADNDVDISKAAILPDVSFQGSRSSDTGLNASRGIQINDDSYTLNASIPIFQSGAEYSRVRQNKRTRQQRKEEYEASHNETVENITSRWRDLITARATIVSDKSAVESATVALNGVRQEADVGTRTTLDVLDSEQELFQAKVNLVTAQAKEVVAVYDLLAAVGVLTAGDLALNVQIYDPTIHERSVKYRVIGF